jgi:Dolichyl-phosphate-mannose-protein mannosyltransferase
VKPVSSSQVMAWSLLGAAFGVVVYRACVQPIAHDEALTFVWFLDGGVYKLLQFNSTNHVLFTLIAKVFVKVFGVSELSIRVPSVIGAAAYLLTLYLLCQKILGDGLLMLITLAMLCLNPQIMDFMVAARGYSLGMACLCIAMYFLARIVAREYLDPDDKETLLECSVASVFLALSVASNLTNLIPAFGLAVSFYAIAMHGAGVIHASDRKLRMFARHFLAPGMIVGLFILWPFLIQARPQQFRMGLQKWSEALRDIFNSSFLYKWTGDIYAYSLGAIPPSPGSWQERVSDCGVYILLPSLFIAVLAGVILAVRRSFEPSKQQSIYCCLFGGAAICTVALTAILHIVANVNYPVARTCLYFIPLFTLGGMLSAKEFSWRLTSWPLKFAGLSLSFIILCDYAAALNTKYFRYNAYDSISRTMFQVILNDARSRALSTVRVGGTWWYQPEIDFYRRRYKAQSILPYDIKDPSYFWQTPNSLMPRDYNYFVFIPGSDPELAGPQVRVIFHDKDVGVTVISIAK